MQQHVNRFASGLGHGGIPVNKPKMKYFDKEDILHLVISDEPQSGSLELSPNITAELNDNGELIGIEILNASSFIQDTVLDTNFAKKLTLADVQVS